MENQIYNSVITQNSFVMELVVTYKSPAPPLFGTWWFAAYQNFRGCKIFCHHASLFSNLLIWFLKAQKIVCPCISSRSICYDTIKFNVIGTFWHGAQILSGAWKFFVHSNTSLQLVRQAHSFRLNAVYQKSSCIQYSSNYFHAFLWLSCNFPC